MIPVSIYSRATSTKIRIETKMSKDGMNTKVTSAILLVLAIIVGSLLGAYLLASVTGTESYQESYQDPVYKNYTYDEPIYRNVSYQEPVYGTLYTGTIGKWNYTSGDVKQAQEYTITNAISGVWNESGTNHGAKKYTVYICWSLSDCQYYYDIEFSNLKESRGVIRYDTKTNPAVDHYETKSKDVIDHYETKYQTKYKIVTKQRWEWIVGVSP
ncbi:MAG: hypothetical protein OIN84_10975 [Candidatus Methanoperedens sp.]|nr:hypothetical protein [Candidatus Methanoperedens sp.]